jgi:hypothetical protein
LFDCFLHDFCFTTFKNICQAFFIYFPHRPGLLRLLQLVTACCILVATCCGIGKSLTIMLHYIPYCGFVNL